MICLVATQVKSKISCSFFLSKNIEVLGDLSRFAGEFML